MSDWAKERAEETWLRAVRRCFGDPLLKQEIVGPEEFAAALREAEQRGAERERWECHAAAEAAENAAACESAVDCAVE